VKTAVLSLSTAYCKKKIQGLPEFANRIIY